MNKPPYEGKEFEALALRYEDHVELLRTLTQIDLRLTTALVTIQFVLCGFIATQTSISLAPRFGLIIVDIAVCSLVCRLLYLNYVRRREAVATLKNINCALGFLEKGIYLYDKAINPSKEEYARANDIEVADISRRLRLADAKAKVHVECPHCEHKISDGERKISILGKKLKWFQVTPMVKDEDGERGE